MTTKKTHSKEGRAPSVPKRGEGEIPHKLAGKGRRGGSTCPAPGAGKLVKVTVGGELHRRGGKTHFPCEL
jgi:hypothetical protein